MNYVLVFIGGGLGSVVRFGISELVRRNFQFMFPAATLASNVLSCLVLALTLGVFREKAVSNPSVAVLIVTGFCGGFSTFSTFSFETVGLVKDGQLALALINIVISVGLCFGIVYLLAKNV